MKNTDYRDKAWFIEAYARVKTTGIARECGVSLGVVSYRQKNHGVRKGAAVA